MKHYKKTAAMALCLLISLTAAVPYTTAFAEGESSGVSDTAEPDGDETSKASGDFTYTVDDDGNAHITACSSTAEEINVPESIDGVTVTEIEKNAFMDCTAKKITIPAGIVYISAENPFAPCFSLEEIAVDEKNKNYTAVDGILYSKDMKTIMSYPHAKDGETFTIPDGVEEVGIAAFTETALTEIILPDSISTLNRHCFCYNQRLTSIDMSGTSVTVVPVMAFVQCDMLKDVVFSDSTVEIQLAAFMNCKNLAEVDLPPALKSVGQNAFMGTAMTKVIIPESVTYIDYSAFGYEDEATTVSDFLIIGAANSAASRYAVDMNSEYDYKNDFKFVSTEVYEKQIAYEALNPQVIGDFEYAIIDGEGCLTRCVSIEDTINIPAEMDGVTITSIYYGAFLSCGSKNIVLPETVKTIGEDAFSEYVESITIPGGCTLIEGDEPFLTCHSLKSITVTEGDGEYSSQDGVLYNKDKSRLIAYPQACENAEFTVPDTVKSIAPSAFCYNPYLTKVTLKAVETIGDFAFEGCTALSEAILPKCLKEVYQNAFLGCSAMNSIRVYGNVEYIGMYAFGYDYDEELAATIQANTTDEDSGMMPYSVMDGFKMYVEKDSLAMQYAQDCGIESVTDTVAVGGKNVDKTFIYIVLGALAAAVLAVIGIFTGKGISKKKKAKAAAERKAKSAKKKTENPKEVKEESSDES